MSLALKTGHCTLQGHYRPHNEDAVTVAELPGATLCLVADAGGGWEDDGVGAIHSQRACTSIREELGKFLAPAVHSAAVKDLIRNAFLRANEEILAIGRQDEKLRGGTTAVLACWQKRNEILVAGVGDSRCYLLRGSQIEQVTVDDTLAQALVAAGTISTEEAKEHKFRNILWRYLGCTQIGDGPAVTAVPIQGGDRFLLGTDGLTNVLPEGQLLRSVQALPEVQPCAEALCQLAVDFGSHDNVSCIVIAVEETHEGYCLR